MSIFWTQNRALKTTSLARVLIRTWWNPVGPSSSLRWDCDYLLEPPSRSMWMGRHQERHTAIFVPLGEETGLASCPVWWGKVYVLDHLAASAGKAHLLSDHDAAPTASARLRTCNFA